MRESIGGTALFQITIIFLLLFTGVMCITINHSKAFAVKDKILDIIQNSAVITGSDNKLDDEIITDITNYINESGYRITNKCPSDYTGYTRNGYETTGKDASICVRAVNVSKGIDNSTKNKVGDGDMPNMYYYDIILFYQIDAPIISDVFNFSIKSSTKVIYS